MQKALPDKQISGFELHKLVLSEASKAPATALTARGNGRLDWSQQVHSMHALRPPAWRSM
jgi:hypothetical protein